jgi:hypothetical protein
MVSFEELDGLRRQHGFTREQVYERAAVSGETWRRTAAGRTSPTLRTLEKLKAGLHALIAEKETACGKS